MAKLQKHERVVFQNLKELATSYGLRAGLAARRGKHVTKVEITGGSRVLKFPIASSPRDADHLIDNSRRQVLRAIEAMLSEDRG